MGVRFLKIAVIYLVIGVLLGGYMGLSQQFTLAPVHAHLVLLGWATFALAGLIYHLYPAASLTRLARVHFWLHNLGMPVFMIGLAVLLSQGGTGAAGPVVGISAVVVIIGLAAFAANVLVNVRASP